MTPPIVLGPMAGVRPLPSSTIDAPRLSAESNLRELPAHFRMIWHRRAFHDFPFLLTIVAGGRRFGSVSGSVDLLMVTASDGKALAVAQRQPRAPFQGAEHYWIRDAAGNELGTVRVNWKGKMDLFPADGRGTLALSPQGIIGLSSSLLSNGHPIGEVRRGALSWQCDVSLNQSYSLAEIDSRLLVLLPSLQLAALARSHQRKNDQSL
jgi:hypothetical protein